MRKALILVWEFPPGPGGIGQHAFSLAQALDQQGYQVTILSTADYATPNEIDSFDKEHNHLNIIRVPRTMILHHLRRITLAWRLASKLQPEHIICSGKGALWLLPLLKIGNYARLSAFLHGSEIKLPQFLPRQLTGFSLRFADRLFCVSHFTRGLLPTQILNRKSVRVLPNGIRSEELPVEWPQPLSEIEQVGSPRLLTVGQLSMRKGQHRVIQALPFLRKKWPDIHYHMVGLDTDRGRLLLLAKDLCVEEHITIHGRLTRQNLLSAYCAADVFMMLSENQPSGDVEGFGIAILEANYFGVPAIGAKDCGIEEAIATGANGYLVDGNDTNAIGHAIEKCLWNRSNIQPAMRKWVENHDWNNLIKQFLV